MAKMTNSRNIFIHTDNVQIIHFYNTYLFPEFFVLSGYYQYD